MNSYNSHLSMSNFPNSKQFRETCILQEFPFASPIMRYIWMNPLSPEVYQKLIKSCKIFFVKNPILVCKCLWFYQFQRWKYCTDCCKGHSCSNSRKIDFDNVKVKVWLTGTFSVFTHNIYNFALTFASQIFRYDVKYLKLRRQLLSDEELKLFLNGVEVCNLYECIIKYKTGEGNLPLEKIVKIASGCKNLFVRSHSDKVTCKNVSELADACQALQQLHLSKMSNDFNLPVFYQHLKKNKIRTKILIDFETTIPIIDAIDAIAEEILNTESFDFLPPAIQGTDFSKFQRILQIQETEAAKYS